MRRFPARRASAVQGSGRAPRRADGRRRCAAFICWLAHWAVVGFGPEPVFGGVYGAADLPARPPVGERRPRRGRLPRLLLGRGHARPFSILRGGAVRRWGRTPPAARAPG